MSDRVRDRLAVRVEASSRTGFVFPSTRSKTKHVTLSCLSREFRRVRNLLGLSKDLVLYTARHSFATWLVALTGNIKLVADTLGHTDTKITGTYLHPSSGGLSSLINERNARRTSESAATLWHTMAHSPSGDSCGVPQGPHDGMYSQVAVLGSLKSQNERPDR